MTDMSVPPEMAGHYPNVLEQDKSHEQDMRAQRLQIQTEMHQLDTLLMLRQAPGWSVYMQILAKRLNDAVNGMLTKKEPHALAVGQGRCLEASEQVSILNGWAQSRDMLAKRLAEVETELRLFEQQGARR